MDAVLIVCLGVAFLLAYLYRDLHRSEHTWYAVDDSTQDDAMDIAQPGDLLFYRSTGTLIERLVVAATNDGNPRADFVHVAIVKDEQTVIEATWRGVVESPMPDLDMHIVGYRLPIHSREALQQALAGAQGQVGWKYGVADILSQGLRLLRLPFTIGRLHSLDCSHLAAEFAAWACDDATLYALVCDSGADVSPNDLARYYGLVKVLEHAQAA